MVKKSVQKRIKITKTGKLLRRRMAQDHFRANKPAKQIRRKRSQVLVHKSDYKKLIKYLK